MQGSEVVIDGRRQFVALYRSFLFRVVDLELLSASGDIRNLLGQFAALLAAYSFVLALFTVSHFALSTAARSKLAVSAWGLEEFYFSTTITVVGLFSVLAWDASSPDRRDGFILDPLPVRARTILGAKYASIVTGLSVSIIAVNVFTGLSFPFAIASGGIAGALRCFVAYWMTLGAAGAFTFGFICAVQNAAATLLSYRVFQRLSSFLQLAALFGILTLFFLTPPLATPSRLSAPANQQWLALLPSYWFLGLFQALNGAHDRIFKWLAWRAVWGLTLVCLAGSITAAMSYGRNMRRAIEQPDIAPGASRGALSRVAATLTFRILRDPIDRAILLFSARTLARSRQHRLVLAVYISIALAISLAYAKSLVYGTSGESWTRPGEPLLIAGLVTLFFTLIGTRAVFALPFVLQANWIFRITAVRSPAAYFSAVRKALFAVAAIPLLSIAGITYLSIWPNRAGLEHLLVLLMLAVLLAESLLRRFRKIPFACSYLPGKSNLKLKFGIAGVLFLVVVELGASL